MDAGASVTDRDRYVCRRTLRLPAGAGARYTYECDTGHGNDECDSKQQRSIGVIMITFEPRTQSQPEFDSRRECATSSCMVNNNKLNKCTKKDLQNSFQAQNKLLSRRGAYW